MDININLSLKQEYNVTVENVVLRLLVNQTRLPSEFFDTLNIAHKHIYTELFVCLSEKIDIHTQQGNIRLFKGDVAIVPANISHHIIDSANDDVWCSLGFSIAKKQGNHHSDLYKKIRPIYECDKLLVFRNLTEICERIKTFRDSSLMDGDLPALEFACILLNLALKNTHTNFSDNQPPKRMPDIHRMAWFEDLLSNRYSDPLTVGAVANMLHISPRHLSRIIKAKYGVTFHKCLVNKRLEKAAGLLETTDSSINTILHRVGYNKSSLFYKDFSAHFGMTPTEYRNKFSSFDSN